MSIMSQHTKYHMPSYKVHYLLSNNSVRLQFSISYNNHLNNSCISLNHNTDLSPTFTENVQLKILRNLFTGDISDGSHGKNFTSMSGFKGSSNNIKSYKATCTCCI